MKKFVSVFICIIFIISAFSLSGCSSDIESIDLIYPFGGNISSYDPQIASTSDEFLIIENCFEGLVRCDDEGNILPACASSWQISDDNLTYTFHLKTGLRWYIFDSVKEKMGENYNPEITAADFAFALKRAVDPATQCPLYATLSAIENAPEINSGSCSTSDLGVRVIDDYTLEIRLSSPDNAFLTTLSTAAAMPCNEEFFNSTGGRYGLSTQYVLFNGQFYISRILDTSYVLRNNGAYKGSSPAPASDLTLKIVEEDESLADLLKSGYYDAAYIRGYESTEIGEKNGISLVPYSNTTWSVAINSSSGILSNADARHALALALSDIDADDYPYLTAANGLVPPSCTLYGESYVQQSGNLMEGKDSARAVSLWKEAVKDTSTYTIELTVLAPENMEGIAKLLLQGVQSSIGSISNADAGKKISFSLKLETKPEKELKADVKSGNYDIALYPLTATASSPVSFLQDISGGILSDEFDKALKNVQTASASDQLSALRECEEALIDTYCYVPVFYETCYYASAKGVSGVQFHPGSGRVCFVYATRSA